MSPAPRAREHTIGRHACLHTIRGPSVAESGPIRGRAGTGLASILRPALGGLGASLVKHVGALAAATAPGAALMSARILARSANAAIGLMMLLVWVESRQFDSTMPGSPMRARSADRDWGVGDHETCRGHGTRAHTEETMGLRYYD